jgi:hypothetical protein
MQFVLSFVILNARGRSVRPKHVAPVDGTDKSGCG